MWSSLTIGKFRALCLGGGILKGFQSELVYRLKAKEMTYVFVFIFNPLLECSLVITDTGNLL